MTLGLGLVSPGVSLKEIDLTKGSVLQDNQFIGALAGPFVKGPVEEAVTIRNENQFIEVFGRPVTSNNQSDYYHVAESYLSYGGVLKIIRCSDNTLNSSNVGVGSTTSISPLNIKNYNDYLENHQNSTSWEWAAKTPGSWSNNLKVCVIDDFADQIISGITTLGTYSQFTASVSDVSGILVGSGTTIGISTSGLSLGLEVRCDVDGVVATGTTITNISNDVITISNASLETAPVTTTFDFGTSVGVGTTVSVGMAVTCKLSGSRVNIGKGTTTSWNTDTVLQGTLTSVGSSQITVKWNSYTTSSGVSTSVQYKLNSNFEVKTTDGQIFVSGNSLGSPATATIQDWYNEQTLGLEGSIVYWKSIAPKPVSSTYARSRTSFNDSLHIAVVDDIGKVTGVVGNIVEKFSFLSKAKDAVLSSKSLYYKERLARESQYIYAGYPQTGVKSKYDIQLGAGVWGLEAKTGGVNYNLLGNKTFNLVGGANYSGGYQATLSGLSDAYNVIADETEHPLDFILGGPSLTTKEESQAKANKLIEIAESRKDCIATISPFKDGVVGSTDNDTQTANIIDFFNDIDSSSYAVFDSGYKFIFDRFTNTYKYIPCNGDVAGLMAKTSIESHSWYSPAGDARGSLKNVIKLAYNPNQVQRDQLYINRVNPIVNSPGGGVILFGDKTAQTFVSSFDRINVRRLFIEIEQVISNISRSFLFEFNDEFTRSSFLSQVEPYLRDIEAKRGITEFVVVCDDTNNTPDVIDRNEFVAEIYVKPARSINFIGLTFVATRTGISFDEVIGRF